MKATTKPHVRAAVASPGPVIFGVAAALTSVLCPQQEEAVVDAKARRRFQKRTRSTFRRPFPSGRNPFVLSGKRVVEPLNYLTPDGSLSSRSVEEKLHGQPVSVV